MSYIPEPITRIDKYLAYIAGNMDVTLPDYPITRKEHYLAAWAEKSGFEDVEITGDPPLTLEDAIGKPLKGMKVYGKSKQVTTTGAQLFPPPSLGSQEKNGITIDCMEGGKIHISGTTEILTDFYVSRLQLSAGTYTFSTGVNIDASVLRYALVDDIGMPYFDVHSDYTTDTIKEPIEVELLLRVYAGKTIDLTVKPMLNAGSAPLPWEPYTGGKPSPSPDYPQEIESVGMKWSTGANLLDISQWNAYEKTYGLTMTIDENGYFQLEGTYDNGAGAGNIGNCMFRFMRMKVGTVFPDGVKFAGGMMKVSENVSNLYFLCTGLSEHTPCLVISFSAVNGENIKIRFRPMLYVGDTAPEWEPYTGGVPKPYGDKIGVTVGNGVDESQSMSISTPNGLPGIPVASGGNYTDADGQQWVCDEVDFARGVYVQNIKVSKSLNKLEWYTWGVNKATNGITGFFTYNIDIPKIGEVVSNIALYNGDIYGGKKAGICASTIKPTSTTPYMILSVRNDTISDISSDNAAIQSFKEMLAETDAYMMYVLATPIETPLASDQLAAYKALHTYKGTTIIDNDAGAYMSVKYEKMK
nr:MAG TPA: hypothetical protein [Caudoviricetes sp.]